LRILVKGAPVCAVAETLYATDVHELRASAIGVLERRAESDR
jgi:hypothetical protein